jgi:tetratricopeptide (TPR) repeat protein
MHIHGMHVFVQDQKDMPEEERAAQCAAAQRCYSLAQANAIGEPNSFKARVNINMGIAYERNGQMFKACECYQEAMMRVPSSPRALKLYGSALLHLGQPAEAAGCLRQATALAHETPGLLADAHCDLGSALVSFPHLAPLCKNPSSCFPSSQYLICKVLDKRQTSS